MLIEDWCQQYPSHSIGDLEFGADGALYVTGGDGASFNYADYGQSGNPRNPCGDPPGGVGGVQTPPTAEGGALRSPGPQDGPRSGHLGRHGDPRRPGHGRGAARQPAPRRARPERAPDRRLRPAQPLPAHDPPGTSEPWIGDVGWSDWEEIDRIPDRRGAVENFGWPCFEGTGQAARVRLARPQHLREPLQPGRRQSPLLPYNHAAKVVSEETCPAGSSSISGLAFNPTGSPWPAEFDGALFFTDYSRDCIWVMERNGGAAPDPARLRTFRDGAPRPGRSPDRPRRRPLLPRLPPAAASGTSTTPRATRRPARVVGATPTNGATPLHVDFTAAASSDPDPGDTIGYEWDLDGDGEYDDGVGPSAEFTYADAGSYLVGVRVTDDHGASATDSVAITAGNTPPTATIAAPSLGQTLKVNDPISFAGSASDAQDGTLDASRLDWELVIQHCPSNCHDHSMRTWTGVDHDTIATPDHEYPAYLELTLTATDSGGLTDSHTVRLDYKTVTLSFASNPTGLKLTLNNTEFTTPFTKTVIQGSRNGLSVLTPQTLPSGTYDFTSWSNGQPRVHEIFANANGSFTATFTKR